jgi:hypothetical protein
MRLLLIVIFAAACGGQAAPSTPPLSASLPSGIYIDGAQGTPHYFIALTTKDDGTFLGTVSFLAQDGQTSAAFTFTATTQSSVATLTTSMGTIITATFGSKAIDLGECTQYLSFAQSNAQCSFTYSPGGL